jgi:hypothetical protein
VGSAGELESAGDHQETAEQNEASQPRRHRARRRGRAAMRRSGWQARRHRLPLTVPSGKARVKRGRGAPGRLQREQRSPPAREQRMRRSTAPARFDGTSGSVRQ